MTCSKCSSGLTTARPASIDIDFQIKLLGALSVGDVRTGTIPSLLPSQKHYLKLYSNLQRTVLREFLLRLVLASCLALLTGAACPEVVRADDNVTRSAVKVFATQHPPDFSKPWTRQNPREVVATGTAIEENRILTNAHVVAYASQIYVQSYQSAERVSARVLAVAPGIDLALLAVDDPSFFDNCLALSFAGQLPKAKDTVNVYGYPLGGEELSITEGIVSRIIYGPMQFNQPCLQVQIDAALNPGNSGGPAVSKGKMIGLVSSKMMKAESIGYLIPVEEIRMFLNDVADGIYHGQPAIQGLELQTLENEALRKRLKLGKGESGIMVTRVQSPGPDFPLTPFDVITHVGQYPVDNEGYVRVNGDLRLAAQYLAPRLARDGKVPVRIIRDGVVHETAVPVAVGSRRLIRFTGLEYPRYFIYGPLVFSPITETHIHFLSQNEKAIPFLTGIGNPIASRYTDEAVFEDEELVSAVSPILSHKISKGYELKFFSIVSDVNETKIKNLVHLVETLRDCRDEFIVFRFAGSGNEILVFRREEIEAATEEILGDYGIRHQYSQDLRTVWEKTKDDKTMPAALKSDVVGNMKPLE
ncbi:MAG: trypsin-like peptidase domain-containing protein [Pseudomonadota bacterium]